MQKKYKNLFLFGLLIPLLLLSSSSATSALTASPSASTAITPQDVTESVKKRLQETLANPPAEATISYKSFVGVIRDVIKETLIIEDKDGRQKIVIKDNATILRSPGNKTIPVDSIRIDDYVISIGTLKESDELEATRVIVSTDPLTTTTKVSALARLTKITKNTLTATIVNTGETKTLLLNTKTALKSSLGESLEATDLSVGDSIIYTAVADKNTSTLTSLMRIGFADPNATPSASPTSTKDKI